MHIQARHFGSLLAVLLLSAPVWAHTDTAALSVTDTTTIGGTQLKPGQYNLEVKDNQTEMRVVDSNTGKTVAEVPCQWIQLEHKPNNTEVLVTNSRVTEVDFNGKTQAVQIGNH
jgi:hypothetical protein